MKKRGQILFLSGVAVTMLLAGCGSVPQQEIDSANAAIEMAKSAGAEIYAAESFSALKDSMMVAMESVEKGKSKVIKNFGEAKEKLGMVSEMASKVSTETDERIIELKSQIDQAVTDITTLVAENRQLVSEAPKGKEGTSALVAIKGEIDMIELSVIEAGTMKEAGSLIGSYEKLSAAKEKAMALKTELTEVISKYKKAAGSR